MMEIRQVRLFVGALLLCLFAAACGDDSKVGEERLDTVLPSLGPLDLWAEYPQLTEIDPNSGRGIVPKPALEQYVANIAEFIGKAGTDDVVMRMNYPRPGTWDSLTASGQAVDAAQMFQALVDTYPFYGVSDPPEPHTLAAAIAANPGVDWWILLSSNGDASWQGKDINTPAYARLPANQHAVDGFALNIQVVEHYEALLQNVVSGFSFAGVVFEAENSGLDKNASGPGLDANSNTIAKQLYSIFTTPPSSPIPAIAAAPASGQWAATGAPAQANPVNDFTLGGVPVIGHWFPQWYDASSTAQLAAYASGSIGNVVAQLDAYKPNFSPRVAADKSTYTAMISAENGMLRKYVEVDQPVYKVSVEVKDTAAKFFGEGFSWSDVDQAAQAIKTKHGVRVMVYNLAPLPLNQTRAQAADVQPLKLP